MKATREIESIPKSTLKALVDITGEPRIDLAFSMTVKDVIEHRLEKIEREIAKFENNYRENFSAFKREWTKRKDKFSYKIEKDYIEWEGLITRKKKLKKAMKWL